MLPLIERIGGDEATTPPDGFAKKGLGDNLFSAGIDGGESELFILGPEGDETPTHESEFALAGGGVQTDDRLNALGGRVEVGSEEGHVLGFDAEPVGEDFLRGSTSESAAHSESIARR
jgi:hypothetical protein